MVVVLVANGLGCCRWWRERTVVVEGNHQIQATQNNKKSAQQAYKAYRAVLREEERGMFCHYC